MSRAATSNSSGPHILVVRLGAMGDVIHALPAVASLKHSFPGSQLTWLIEAQWAHVIDRNLELAADAGAANILRTFPLPMGTAEGELPAGNFILASPLAGWRSKQWPLAFYSRLASRIERELELPLVLDGPPGSSH